MDKLINYIDNMQEAHANKDNTITSSIIKKLTEKRDTYKKIVDELSTKKNNTDLIEWIIRLLNENDEYAKQIRDNTELFKKLDNEITVYKDMLTSERETLRVEKEVSMKFCNQAIDYKDLITDIFDSLKDINIFNMRKRLEYINTNLNKIFKSYT